MGGITLAAPFLIFACREEPKPRQTPAPSKAAGEHKQSPPMEKAAPAEGVTEPAAGTAGQHEHNHGMKMAAPAEGVTEPAPKTAAGKAQTMCPVMGGKIDKAVYFDHAGKRVYFCCAGCPAQFKEDPEKYVKKMEDEGIVLEKVPIGNP